MAHRSLSQLVLCGMEPTTASTLITMLGDEGLPSEIRILDSLSEEPWRQVRSGLMVIGMTPDTSLARVSQLIQSRTTWWEVVVCLTDVLWNYHTALLAQGAALVIRHPQDDLEGCANQLRATLKSMSTLHTDAFGLEVSDLIQLFGEKRIDKTIRITGGGTMGSIFMRAGNVLHAEALGDLEGMEAFRRLISLNTPEIRVQKGCLTGKATLGMNAMSALLEGSRVLDEEANSMEQVGMFPAEELDPDLEHVFGSNESLDEVPRVDLKPPAANDSLFDELDLGDHDHEPKSNPLSPQRQTPAGGAPRMVPAPPSSRRGPVERT